jgi:alpha-tubulin suppressor-like RCC1 family protein
VTLDDGAVVDIAGVRLSDGTRVDVGTYEWGGRFYDVHPKIAAARWGAVKGLLGDADGAAGNDASLPNGDVVFGPGGLDGPAGTSPLYDQLAPAWVVSPTDRVLTGAQRSYQPPADQPPRTFPQTDIDRARAECQAVGILTDPLLTACVFDRVAIGLPASADLAAEQADLQVTADAGNTPSIDPLPSSGRIATSENHTCAVTAGGVVKCWGSNYGGQLGSAVPVGGQSAVPVEVADLGTLARSVATGGNHTCAVTISGGVKCWGRNAEGQLGDGTTTGRVTPVDVTGLTSGVAEVTAGFNTTCALLESGLVTCWGSNDYGQVGDGTTTNRSTRKDVIGLSSGVAEIDSATSGFLPGTSGYFGEHICARMVAGAVKCWGRNTDGQLGDGTTVSRSTPVPVAGLSSGVADISVGGLHSCAVLADGSARCWGDASNLGADVATDSPSPLPVIGVSGARAIDGDGMTCVQLFVGSVKCWGYYATSAIAVDVPGVDSDGIAFAVGSGHACALRDDETARCWGRNGYGQLGNGTVQDSPTPVIVTGF